MEMDLDYERYVQSGQSHNWGEWNVYPYKQQLIMLRC